MERRENGRIRIGMVILLLLIIAVVAGVGVNFWYKSEIKPVQSNSEKVVVEIVGGSGISKIASQLEENGLIKNADAFKIYCKLNKRIAMQAGKYELNKNMSVADIVAQLEKGNIVDETVTITFPEGKNMRWIVSTIAEKTNNSENHQQEN